MNERFFNGEKYMEIERNTAEMIEQAVRTELSPWKKANMELPPMSIKEISRIIGLSPRVVLNCIVDDETYQLTVPGNIKDLTKPRRSKFWDRTSANIWSEGQRYQRKFQFQPVNTKGKPTRRKIETRIEEEQVQNLQVTFVPKENTYTRDKEQREVKKVDISLEADLLQFFIDKGRYKPVEPTAVKELLRRGLAGEQIYMPTIACYNHIYEGLGISMDIDPAQGLLPPSSDRRDLVRIATYIQNWQFLKDFIPTLIPLIILPDVDLRVLGEICKMPRGVYERAALYKTNLEQTISQTGIPVVAFSELLNKYDLWQLFSTVLRDCQRNIGSSYVNQRELEQQIRFDAAYYNGVRKADATPTQLRKRVILNFALYAAQKAVLQQMFTDQLLFFSVESPMEDKRYAIRDKQRSLPGMPIIYPTITPDSSNLELDFYE